MMDDNLAQIAMPHIICDIGINTFLDTNNIVEFRAGSEENLNQIVLREPFNMECSEIPINSEEIYLNSSSLNDSQNVEVCFYDPHSTEETESVLNNLDVYRKLDHIDLTSFLRQNTQEEERNSRPDAAENREILDLQDELEENHYRDGTYSNEEEYISEDKEDNGQKRRTGKNFCKSCGKRFPKPSLLLRHEVVHSNIKLFECSQCLKRFSQKSSLHRHSLIHSGLKPFNCESCSMSFSQRVNLLTHMKRVHPQRTSIKNKFSCPKCTCVFKKLNSLNRHISKVHPDSLTENKDEDPFAVENVLAQLKQLQDGILAIHQKNNFDPYEKTQTRDKSVVEVPSNIQRSNREKNTDSGNLQDYIEGNYSDKCKGQDNNLISEEICGNEVEKPHRCEICGRNFTFKSNLHAHTKIHKRNLPQLSKVYHCGVCREGFSSLRSLNFHAKLHCNYKPYSCPTCKKEFGSSNNLKIHQQIHREKDPLEEKIKQLLLPPINLHKNKEETKESNDCRNFQCSMCGFKFKKLSHLKQHEECHSKSKSFQCLTCQRYFSTKGSLGLHTKIHTGHKSKQCDQCDAKFYTNGDLKRHKIMHSNARDFCCPYCNRIYKTKFNCRQHILTHAKGLVFESKSNEPNLISSKEILPDKPQNDTNQQTDTEYDYILLENDLQFCDGNSVITYGALQDEELQFDGTNLQKCKTGEPLNITNITQQGNLREKEYTVDDMSRPQIISIEHLPPDNNFIKNLTEFQNISSESTSLSQIITLEISDEESQDVFDNTNIQIEGDKKKHCCKICHKSFKKPIDFRRHFRTHTKEKPFQCEICLKSFTLKCILKDHEKIHDKNRQKFDCQVCGKSYASKSVLKIHLRLHTGERPHKCEVCSKAFRTHGHKSAHLKIHSKQKNQPKRKT